jgi:hypothetical protein
MPPSEGVIEILNKPIFFLHLKQLENHTYIGIVRVHSKFISAMCKAQINTKRTYVPSPNLSRQTFLKASAGNQNLAQMNLFMKGSVIVYYKTTPELERLPRTK